MLGTNGCVCVWVQVQGKISALEKEVKRARAVEEQVKKDKVSEPRATAHPPCDTVTTVPALLPNLTPNLTMVCRLYWRPVATKWKRTWSVPCASTHSCAR